MAVFIPKPNPPPPNVVTPTPPPGTTYVPGTIPSTGLRVVYPVERSTPPVASSVDTSAPSGLASDLSRRIQTQDVNVATYNQRVSDFNTRWAPYIKPDATRESATFTGSREQYAQHQREKAGLNSDRAGLDSEDRIIKAQRKTLSDAGEIVTEENAHKFQKVGDTYIPKDQWDKLDAKYQNIALKDGLDGLDSKLQGAKDTLSTYQQGENSYLLDKAVTDAAFHPELRDSIRLLFTDDQINGAMKRGHYSWSDSPPVEVPPTADSSKVAPIKQQSILQKVLGFGSPLARLHPGGTFSPGGTFTYTDDSGQTRRVAMGDAPLVGTASAGTAAKVIAAALGAVGVYQGAKQAQESGAIDRLQSAIQDFRDKQGRNPTAHEVVVQDSQGNTATLSQIAAMKLSPAKEAAIGDMPRANLSTAIPVMPLAPEGQTKYTTFPLPEEKGVKYTVFPLPTESSGMHADLGPTQPLKPIVMISTTGTLPTHVQPRLDWDSALHAIQEGIHRGITARPNTGLQILNQQTSQGRAIRGEGQQTDLRRVPGTAAWADQPAISPRAFKGVRAASIGLLDAKMADLYRTGRVSAEEMAHYRAARKRYMARLRIKEDTVTQATDNPKYKNVALSILPSAIPALYATELTNLSARSRTGLSQRVGQQHSVRTQGVTNTTTGTRVTTRTNQATKTREATHTQEATKTQEATRTRSATRTATAVRTNTAARTALKEAEATRTAEATRPAEMARTTELDLAATMALALRKKKAPETLQIESVKGVPKDAGQVVMRYGGRGSGIWVTLVPPFKKGSESVVNQYGPPSDARVLGRTPQETIYPRGKPPAEIVLSRGFERATIKRGRIINFNRVSVPLGAGVVRRGRRQHIV